MSISTGRPGRRLLILALLVASQAGCVTPTGYRGPIGVRNQHPVQLTALRLEPVSPSVLEKGAVEAEVRAAYSSVFLVARRGGDEFVMDGEILRAGLKGSVGLGAGLQLALEIPVAHTAGGFLDHFVSEFHDLFGLNNGGRDRVADDGFRVRAANDGTVAYEMERRDVSLLDVPLELQWHAGRWRSGGLVFDLALRAGVELPTGAEADGYGNGGVDFGAGVVGELQYGPFAFNVHAGRSFVATPDTARAAGLTYPDSGFFGVGVEAALTPDTAALIQLEMDQTMLRQLEGVYTDDEHWLLWIGFRSLLDEQTALEFSFGEDLSLNGPPDFTVQLGLRTALGGPRR